MVNRESSIVLFFHKLISGLIVQSRICFCDQSCDFFFRFKYMEKNLLSLIHNWKRGMFQQSFVVVVVVKTAYSILWQNSVSCSSKKINCNMESETKSVNFSYSVTWRAWSVLHHDNITSMYCFLFSCILSFSKLYFSVLAALSAVVISSTQMFCSTVIWVLKEGSIICMSDLALEFSEEVIFIKSVYFRCWGKNVWCAR